MSALTQWIGGPPLNNWLYPYYPVYQPNFVTYPVVMRPDGLLNETAHIEREKITKLIGGDAVKALIENGYEVVRK